MNRELMRRVDRLEDHPSFGLRRPPIILWRNTGEDEASIVARAKALGYIAGDRLCVISWRGERQPLLSERAGGESRRIWRPDAALVLEDHRNGS